MIFAYQQEKTETIIDYLFQSLVDSRVDEHMYSLQHGITCPYAVSVMEPPKGHRCKEIGCSECRDIYRVRYRQQAKEKLIKELQSL